jgi:hypothetical protein
MQTVINILLSINENYTLQIEETAHIQEISHTYNILEEDFGD